VLRKTIFHSLILILISGCVATPSTAAVQTKEPEPIIIVSTPIPTATKYVTVPPTAIERSEIERLEPEIEKICPPNAEVPINKLGLPSNLGLFAMHENQNLGDTNQPLHSNIFLFSRASPTPDEMENVFPPDGDLVVSIGLSPSGQWMDILRWRKNGPQMSIWIRTSDGKKQWKVADISVRQREFWISDNEILVVGVLNETEYERIQEEDMMPLFSINPFTLEKRPLSPLPQGAVYYYNSYHTRDGNSYSIYYKKNDKKRTHFLFDYAKGTSTPIFPWIDFSDSTVGVGIRPNGAYEVERIVGNGVDFALDLNIEQITTGKNYNDVMKHLSINNDQNLLISPMIAMTKSDILILTGPTNSFDDQKPTPIFLYDYRANLLKDYCIREVQSSVSINFSPDEQFVALTIAEIVDGRDVYHLLILNLKTGYYSIIERMKAIGFGVIQ